MQNTNAFGIRLREARDDRGKSRDALAALTGLSSRYIARLEHGERKPSLNTIHLLAEALGVDISWLIDQRERLAEAVADGGIITVRNVLLDPYGLPGLNLSAAGPPVPLATLAADVASCWELYWAGQFARLATRLPRLITEARTAEQEHGPAACGILAQACQLAADLMVHMGNDDIAYAGAALAVRAAARAEGTEHHDPLLRAVLAGTVGWVLLHQGRHAEAEQVAAAAARGIQPAGKVPMEHLTVYGAALLSAAAPAATAGDATATAGYMDEARLIATRFPDGDRHDRQVSFGPSQVAMQRTHHAMLLGEPGEALRSAKQVNRSDLLTISWGALNMDVAQACLAMPRPRVSAAVEALWTVYETSPQHAVHQGPWRLTVDAAGRAEARASGRMRKLRDVAHSAR